jgi:putative ABC transport system permease protein
MFRNYFKIAFRNLWRNKSYSAINIFGLGVGIAICLLIFLVIQFESSFDNFHRNKERIYRVVTMFKDPLGNSSSSGVPYPMPAALKQDLPQLDAVSQVYADRNTLLAVMDDNKQQASKKFKEEKGVFYTDPAFFKIFDFKWLYGTANQALSDPNSIVLTKDLAEKYFGSWQEAIGKTLKRNNKQLLKVAGILDHIPPNTDFQIKAVAAAETFINKSDDWQTVNSNHSCYVLLSANMKPAVINNLLKGFAKKYLPAESASTTGFQIEPLSAIHYDADAGNFLGRTISYQLINTFKLIALFILLIACVNFVNLTTAQSVNRAKEVSIRKVLGSNRRQLRIQFFGETIIITLSAVIIAAVLVAITLPFIKLVLDRPLSLDIRSNPQVVFFLLITGALVVLLAGFYPALVLSKFNPVTALKSKLAAGSTKGISLRRGLVVVQFIIAQALIIGTLVVVRQMKFFQNARMGFDKEAILTVPIPADSLGRSKVDFLKAALLQRPEIKMVSFSFTPPADNGNWFSNFKFDHSPKISEFAANLKWADADYIPMFKVPLVAGRNYNKGDTANEFVVNEIFLKKLGITNPEDALNKEVDFWDGDVKAPIVGVIKDFHSQSLQQEMEPILLGNLRNTYRIINIKVDPQRLQPAIRHIEQLWTSTYPDYVFEYQFLDEHIANFYKQERQLSKLYEIFAAIAIFLSCLGLYGLASFMAVQRIKEVGIRKVLGASVRSIIYLFSREFIILICVAFVIAGALAWYFMHQWLQDFAYRINLDWWLFALAAMLSLFVALITISFQAIKAAVTNPIKNLRTE